MGKGEGSGGRRAKKRSQVGIKDVRKREDITKRRTSWGKNGRTKDE